MTIQVKPRAHIPVVWHFRLEDPRTGQRQGLANLGALMAILEQEMVQAEGERESD